MHVMAGSAAVSCSYSCMQHAVQFPSLSSSVVWLIHLTHILGHVQIVKHCHGCDRLFHHA